MAQKPQYGTWIRKRKIYYFAAAALVCICLSACSIYSFWFMPFIIMAGISLYIVFILMLSYYRFSPAGGDYQNRVHQLLLSRVKHAGHIADIGCGNGNLAIKLAKKFPLAMVTGIDYWGADWEYGKAACENNARLEEVTNTRFIQDSASKLPLENESMDAVVSCLTFHEVQDVPAKEACIAEALRVLKPGGCFVFFDLFDDVHYYPQPQDVLGAVLASGGTVTENKSIHELMLLPYPLNDKKSLRYGRLLAGRKAP